MPLLLHSSTSNALKVYRIMLLQFITLQKDYKALKIIKGATWNKLSAAH